ncbi:hypothetical protein GCM10007859_05800 [Brevundimonas denitrificans]|uniref:KAP NTPase domain-containing protein n=1 Tax=Brevundimonas denitrificans TaxID=1443434 RepID=A0ABQ6BL31_9CAUL|nr:hypothetical protein GCM10007859_05800 [Brevundimonas denitrificans]
MVAVMAAIEECLSPHFTKHDAIRKSWDATKAHGATIVASLLKGASRRLAEKYAGQAIDEIENLLETDTFVPDQIEDFLDGNNAAVSEAVATEVTTLLTKFIDRKIADYKARIDSAAQFQNRLKSILSNLESRSEATLPLFVLIDELDRCRPTYAIEMLEQVKHLFDIDNTIFLIATDGDQLSHSIKAVYGEGFDGSGYLLRFFHRHYRFERRDLGAFSDYLFALNEIDQSKLATPLETSPSAIFVGAMISYDVTLRDAEQIFDILRSCVTMWSYPIPIQLNIILPLIIHHHRRQFADMGAYMDSRQRANTPKSPWNVNAQYLDGGRMRKGDVGVQNLNDSVLKKLSNTIVSSLNSTTNDYKSSYVSSIFGQELQVLHKSRHHGDGPKSVILEYPDLVQSVGRLAAPADDGGLETVG